MTPITSGKIVRGRQSGNVLAALGLAAGLLAGAGASAQDLPFSPAATELCVRAAEPGSVEACFGVSAALCIDTPDGYTTVGMGTCLGRELDYWDARLNTAYADLMAAEERSDAELAEVGSSAPSTAEALRDMQRSWIGFRDASCAYERSKWGGGTGGGPASVDCVMRATAAQTLALEARLAEMNMQ